MQLFAARKKRVLLSGSSGFLGHALAERLAGVYDLCHTYNEHPVRIYGANGMRMPLDRESRMCQIFSEWRPEIVVIASGVTDRARCEEDWDGAYRINVRGITDLLRLAQEIRAVVLYLSCSEVFDGAKGPHIETSEIFPRSRFGKMVSMAEELVLAGTSRGQIVLRLPLVFGWSRGPSKGIVGEIAQAASEGRKVPLREDMQINPIDISDLIRAVDRALDRGEGGVFHVAGPEELSPHAFGKRLCETFGLDPETVTPVRHGDRGVLPPPSGNYVLRADKAYQVLNWRADRLERGLVRVREAWERGR